MTSQTFKVLSPELGDSSKVISHTNAEYNLLSFPNTARPWSLPHWLIQIWRMSLWQRIKTPELQGALIYISLKFVFGFKTKRKGNIGPNCTVASPGLTENI